MTQAAATHTAPENAGHRPRRIPVGSAVYGDIADFLYEEALLLDQLRLPEWLGCLAEDLTYTAPLRMTRALKDQKASVVRGVMHFDDTYRTLCGRVGRLTRTSAAWAEDPPSRTRRLITNIMVDATDNPDEFEVTSYLLLTRSRFEEWEMSVLSAARHDLIRRVGNRLLLARREIILDQSVLGQANLAIFL
jgi:3-phenylpropionate/cinnamic acid dioxygenase small subunit